jgi:hypothetical protein
MTFLEQPNSPFKDILHEMVRFVTGEITVATAFTIKVIWWIYTISVSKVQT